MVHIRPFAIGDASSLRAVYFSSVHQLASRYYTEDQIHAWAPQNYDRDEWARRIGALQPFVAMIGDEIAGYADLQSTGYIDHFFVSGSYAGRGVGTALLQYIQSAAVSQGVECLHADVSLSAEGFFSKNGFLVEARKTVVIRGVEIQNARMSKTLRAPFASAASIKL